MKIAPESLPPYIALAADVALLMGKIRVAVVLGGITALIASSQLGMRIGSLPSWAQTVELILAALLLVYVLSGLVFGRRF